MVNSNDFGELIGNFMQFIEQLPIACPEADAVSHEGTVYRLVSDEPCELDFLSHRYLYPEKLFNASDCRARSLSVFTDFEAAKCLLGLPMHANKKVAAVELTQHAGLVKKTGKSPHHLSWWRASNFVVLDAIKEATS